MKITRYRFTEDIRIYYTGCIKIDVPIKKLTISLQRCIANGPHIKVTKDNGLFYMLDHVSLRCCYVLMRKTAMIQKLNGQIKSLL